MTFRRTPTREPPPPTPRTDTRVIRLITQVYSMIDADIADLTAQLLQQMTREYRVVIQQQLRLYGCQKTVTGPDPAAQAWLLAKAQKDAQSIARTYNTQLANEVQRLYDANPRGNRSYYVKRLEAWTTTRNTYKLSQISLQTAISARDYAQQRFRKENGIDGLFIFAGPPPVCEICIRRKALGVVSAENGPDKYGDSQHIGCPHFWQQVILQKIDCDTVWTG